jgi:hypothetical protein
MSYYLVRIGEGSKYVEEGRKGGFIGIGYGQVTDLRQFKNALEIKENITNHNTENLSSTKININADRLSCFAFDMQVIMMRSMINTKRFLAFGKRKILISKISLNQRKLKKKKFKNCLIKLLKRLNGIPLSALPKRMDLKAHF